VMGKIFMGIMGQFPAPSCQWSPRRVLPSLLYYYRTLCRLRECIFEYFVIVILPGDIVIIGSIRVVQSLEVDRGLAPSCFRNDHQGYTYSVPVGVYIHLELVVVE